MDVLAAFYPLQFVTERVGGEHVTVTSLTPPGADPHSLELSPVQVGQIETAELIVYVEGLQAATDQAVAATAPQQVLDATPTVAPPDNLARDPHFWQDPTLLAALAARVAQSLGHIDPAHADDYSAQAADLVADLTTLDEHYRTGLAHCAGATLVTSHEAFGYLANRYDLVQVGITGIDPEIEPSPARLRDVARIIREKHVRTLYFEVLTSPKVTQVLADELGVDTDVLDPIEGQTNPDADYLDAMYTNLAALQSGLTCTPES